MFYLLLSLLAPFDAKKTSWRTNIIFRGPGRNRRNKFLNQTIVIIVIIATLFMIRTRMIVIIVIVVTIIIMSAFEKKTARRTARKRASERNKRGALKANIPTRHLIQIIYFFTDTGMNAWLSVRENKSPQSSFGKGQMGSALKGSLQFSCFFDRNFLGTHVNLLLSSQKCQGVPFSPI